MLKVGDSAPPIVAVASDGKRFALYEQSGLCTVIYFFPKAFTPGCTTETREFRKHYVELELAGVTLVGVSTDDRDTQCRFATSLDAPFPMLGDNDRSICRAYDVLWPLVGVAHRVTYVVAPDLARPPTPIPAGRCRRSSTTSSTSRPTGTRCCASSTPGSWPLDVGRALGRMRAMTTETFLVLSALGPDRPGLVAEVTEYLTERGANIEDSRMAVLGGDFGVLVLVSGRPERIAAIEEHHELLSDRTGLSVMLRRTKSPTEHRRAAVIPCLVTAEAIDQEGIVRAVSRALHRVGVNIVSLHTTAYEAPVTGSPLFRLEALIDVPQTTGVARVRKAMEEVATAENLDIDVRSLINPTG